MKPSESGLHKAQLTISFIANCFELLMAVIVIIAIIISLVHVPEKMRELFYGNEFNSFLNSIFQIVIGIELLKMFCRHNLDSVVEVMIFTVSRGMVIEHMPIFETLIGIVALAVLFLIRKFLFVSALDKDETDSSKGREVLPALFQSMGRIKAVKNSSDSEDDDSRESENNEAAV